MSLPNDMRRRCLVAMLYYASADWRLLQALYSLLRHPASEHKCNCNLPSCTVQICTHMVQVAFRWICKELRRGLEVDAFKSYNPSYTSSCKLRTLYEASAFLVWQQPFHLGLTLPLENLVFKFAVLEDRLLHSYLLSCSNPYS